MELSDFKMLTNSQIRSVYGGAEYTGKGDRGEDFIDNCGWTSYDDCGPKSEDGLPDDSGGTWA